MSANKLKWSSIENVVTAVFGPVARLAALAEDDSQVDALKATATLRTFKDRVLRNRIRGSLKIDGTNVGKDAATALEEAQTAIAELFTQGPHSI